MRSAILTGTTEKQENETILFPLLSERYISLDFPNKIFWIPLTSSSNHS